MAAGRSTEYARREPSSRLISFFRGFQVDALVLRASTNSLCAARSLGRAGYDVAVAAAPSEDPAVRSSRYVSRFVRLDQLDDRAVDTLLELPGSSASKPFLFATGDEDALLVARHQERLAQKYCFVTPAFQVLEAIVDKARLYETARQHGIPHPKFHVVRASSDIEAALAAVGTPCYVKPALGHEWRRVRRGKLEKARDPDELRRVLQDFIALGLTAIPTEIIPGADSDLHALCVYIGRDGQPLGWRTKRKIRQYPLGIGDGSAQDISDEPTVAEQGLRLLAITGHRGAATVEFKRDPRDGRFVLMEVNVRTVSGQQLITSAGLDVPLLAFHDATSRPLPEAPPVRKVRWLSLGLDFRAFRELRGRGEITTLAWLRSLTSCRSFAYFAWDDPVPFLARCRYTLGRYLRGRLQRNSGANL
jgi:predicted ATP-grasp superfamily ATP-dependent carboligase